MEGKDCWPNQSLNDGGVYRTAPATAGLLTSLRTYWTSEQQKAIQQANGHVSIKSKKRNNFLENNTFHIINDKIYAMGGNLQNVKVFFGDSWRRNYFENA